MSNSPELVKPLQTRRGRGWSVVYRDTIHRSGSTRTVYIKTQSGYTMRLPRRLFLRTATLDNEFHALTHCHKNGVNVPKIVWFRRCDEVIELALEDVSNAATLDEFLLECDDNELSFRVAARLGDQIGKLHRSGWSHGALGSEHILIQADDTVTLIDFEKARWNPLLRKRDLARLWRRSRLPDDAFKANFDQAYRSRLSTKGRGD